MLCVADVYAKSSIVYSLKQLKIKSFALSASNLEDSETLTKFNGNHPAIIMYTSGSTGTPKGNIISNRLATLRPYISTLQGHQLKNDKKSII